MSLKSDIDTWSYRSGSELVVKLFGLPFFLMGSFFFWIGLTADKINDGPPTVLMRLAFCSFSSIFILIGLVLIASFSKIVINKREKAWKKYWGILIPLWWKTEKLDDFKHIEICHETRVSSSKNGGSRRTTVFPVRLVQDSNHKKDICEPQNLLKARELSESLSRFFRLPIEDTSLGIKLQREHDEVDSNIREMLKKYDVKVEKPDRPKSLDGRTQEGYNSDGEKCTIITFQRLGLRDKGPLILFSVVSALTGSFILYFLLTFESQHSGGKLFFDVLNHFFAFLFIVPMMIFIPSTKLIIKGLTQTSLSITKHKLTIIRNLGLSFKTKVDLEQLEHLIVRTLKEDQQTGKITLISDQHYIEAASYQSLEELNYVEQLIQYYIQN